MVVADDGRSERRVEPIKWRGACLSAEEQGPRRQASSYKEPETQPFQEISKEGPHWKFVRMWRAAQRTALKLRRAEEGFIP